MDGYSKPITNWSVFFSVICCSAIYTYMYMHVDVHVDGCIFCVVTSYLKDHEGERWYHKRSVTPISVLKAGHVEICLSVISISLSLFLTE